MHNSPNIHKNLFGSKKKALLATKENIWVQSPARNSPKFQLLGKAKQDVVLTPMAVKSINAPKTADKRRPIPKREESEDYVTPLKHKDLNASMRADTTLSDEDWYEGNTLLHQLADHRQRGVAAEDKSRKLAVVEDLRGAFDDMDLRLQEELTTPIVEALDHVSKTHAVMEGTADEDQKRGLECFENASEGAHDLRTRIRKHIKASLDDNQKTLQALFQNLKLAYQKREMLWEELSDAFDKCTEQGQTTFSSLDDSVKRTETLLDKRCRVLNHESGGKGKKDVLKSFLERM